jgi:hypothetical protein
LRVLSSSLLVTYACIFFRYFNSLWRSDKLATSSAENDDGMRVIRRLDGMKRRRVQILRKIDTDDFGPERGTAWANGQTGSTTHQYRSSQEAWR